MFKNIGKKILAVGFSFALCVPCCFASAQPPQYNFAAIRREVELCAEEHNLVFTEHGEVVEPSQMNNEQLLSAYNQLVDQGIARDLEDLDYFTEPPRYNATLLNQAYIGPVIRCEVKRCVQELRMTPHYKGSFFENLDQMNNEQLMWFYNWLLDQDKAKGLGDLMA